MILDLLFPKRCIGCRKFGSYLCSTCFIYLSFDVETICVVCNRQAIDGITHPVCRGRYTIDGTMASIAYNRIAKKLLYNFKYAPYISDLKKILLPIFYEGIIQKEQFHHLLQKKPVLLPIPLTKEKEKRRGYNQARILADGLAPSFDLMVLNALERIKATKSQYMLDRKSRQENIKDAFQIRKEFSEKMKGAVIMLIDDVVTSGATMSEAAKILKKAGAKEVWGVTLAHGS